MNISKQFVDLHGGQIWLESEPGQGTTIFFSLPIELLDVDEPFFQTGARQWVNEYAVREARSRPYQAKVPAALPHYLIIEQGTTLTRLLGRYTESLSVSTVPGVDEGLRVLEHIPAQEVIINTPDLIHPEGIISITTQIDHLPADTPVLACWLPGREDAARQLGALDYLVKPVTAEQLLAAIRRQGPEARKILIVDDEPELMQLWTRILMTAPEGYRVLRAENGFEALEIMRASRPDLVLLDLIMPEKSGYEVLAEKQQDQALCQIPVMVISSTDPINENVMRGPVLIKRGNGLNSRELIDLAGAVSALLSPEGRSNGQAPRADPLA